ncbi:MAG: hypothetical protein V4651_01615 [Bacteroidota bacterium]
MKYILSAALVMLFVYVKAQCALQVGTNKILLKSGMELSVLQFTEDLVVLMDTSEEQKAVVGFKIVWLNTKEYAVDKYNVRGNIVPAEIIQEARKNREGRIVIEQYQMKDGRIHRPALTIILKP